MKKIFLALVMLLSFGSTLWIEKASAAKVAFYNIRNEDDWMKFRQEVEKAKGQYWIDARLEADITTGGGIGLDSGTPYRGTFDGNGHTMTVDINRDDGKPCALFCYVGDVTIKDLHLKGKIKGGIHSAGLIGYAIDGSSAITLDRVWVSTDVSTNDSYVGGIIGHSNKANVYMNDCRFDGSLKTNGKESASYAGSIVGWCNGGGWTFHRICDQSNFKNTYYKLFCIDHNASTGSWYAWWGNGKSSALVTHHGWTSMTYYNKSDQSEIVNIMNAEKAGSWRLFEGKAVPRMNKSAAVGSWNKLSGGATDGYVLQSGRYYVTEDISFTNNSVGGNGLTIADGATVHIYLCNAKLTATGGKASGRTGAGAGIYLPQGSTLYIEGRGSVKATGGNAADGSNGSSGGSASADDSNCNWIHPGDGGAGGAGGGGAGAGIGTSGGNGGAGASGVSKGTIWSYAATNFSGIEGRRGGNGETAGPMGNLYVASVISVTAKGGQAGTYNGSAGGGGSCHLHKGTTWDHTVGPGSGGGGGGRGGEASDIGTGGPGGGGGGSGSSGTTRYGSKWKSGWFSAGSKGGKGGQDGAGGWASNAGDAVYNGARGWESGDNRASGGEGGSRGSYSVEQRTRFDYAIQFNVYDKNGALDKSNTVTYKSNQNRTNATVSIPSAYALGLTKSDKYLSSWYEDQNRTGTARIALDEISIGQGTKNLYAEWKLYEDLFADGHGTKSDPFIIREDQLIDLAEYVNGGGNTRNVYFKQDGNIQVPDILSRRNKGSQWTPIGQTRFFEGDYDGGGYLIRKATIDTNNADVVGIFGKVTGSIHNLGVEESTFKTTKDDSRGGAIAGLLLEYETDQRITGQMHDCYSANNNITATYAGGLVGEMNHSAKMTHSLDIQNKLYGGNIGGLASQIDNSCQVDLCFSGGELSNNGYSQETNSVANIDSDRLKSGEITWLLNDKTAFGVAWYQNLTGQSPVNAYPVLNKECNRVFFYNDQYTNNPGGTFFAFSGQGLKDNPFLINNKADLDKLADYCNKGNNSNAIYFLQTADIDLNGGGLTPVATSRGFGGVYDGGGHTIRNGNIAIDGIAGIFGVVSGTVTRLCVENTTVKYTKKGMRAGGIAARITGNGEISNCLVKDCKIENNGLSGVVGGIAADMFDQGVIKNCLVINTSLSASRTGSICSDTKSGNVISRCYTDGDHITSSDSYADVQNSLPKVSKESLKSGEICHKLNGGINHPDPKWFQNISDGSKLDDIPVLSEDHAIVTRNERGHYTNDIFNLSRLGKGTKDDPYKIATPKDLQDLVLGIGTMKRSNFYIRQTADIDLKDSLFLPIGTCLESFEGYYDGGGHVIKNLEIIGTNRDIKEYLGESVGLFNAISGVVENLGLENCKLTAARVTKRVGGLAGRLTGHGQLRNCFVKNSTIDCNSFEGCVVGALVGEQADTTVIETSYGFQNTIVGMNDGGKQYGYIVGHMGGNAKASQLYTDGPAFCAEWQKGEKNIANSETNVSEFRFNSGDICWLLSGSKNDNTLWRQTMLTDNTPVPDTNHKLVYRHELNDQVMYTNSTEWPYTVWMTLDPNHSDQQAKGIEVFKADKNWVVPSFKFANYAANRVDYELKGWNTEADGKGTFYPADYEMLSEQDDRFYAMWDMLIPIDANPVPVVILPEDTIYFKVYDHGGSKNAYGYDYKGKLTLRAPDEDHVIVLSGTIATEALGSDGKPHDYLVVYDGSASSKERLTNDRAKSGDDFEDVFFSTTEGEKESIGSLTSSEDYMTLEFITDDEKNFDGLDLMVTVLPKDIGPIGQSTETEPYEVATLQDLLDVDKYIRLTGNSKVYIKQTADIDLNGKAFTPIAASVSSFEGHYDGGGHVIRNGKISAPTLAGVFGVVSGTVTRLGVENMTINYEKVDGRSGGIAARLTGNGEISYCYVKGCTVTNNGIQGYYGQGVAGAIVSDMFDQAVIKNCFTLNNKVSATRAADICSDTKSGTLIERCYTDGNYLFRESGATITDSKPNMTAKQFSSGEVCYLLNGEKTENVVWRQTLGTDNIPVLTDGHGVVFANLVNDIVTYSNTYAKPRYNISNKEEFLAFISKQCDLYLTQDIDLGEWNSPKKVIGNLDGGGHTITYRSNNFKGFISEVDQGASIKHLRVEANVVTSNRKCAGIVTCNRGIISDCHFHGNIHSIHNRAAISSISAFEEKNGIIDHCSATGSLTVLSKDGKVYPITQDMNRATNCTWVDPNDLTLHAAQRDSALSAQAEYPVYAKGILDATRPKIILGNDTIFVDDKHLTSLTINDGERFKCSAEVTVDQITYKRRGTNGAYEPWVLPFDYTMDGSMLNGGVAFYRFEKDSVGNILTKQINSSETYQVSANEPLAIKSAKADEIAFKMKLVKDGKTQPMTIKMPVNGAAATMASTKDIANVIATYDSISADKSVKDMMYLWDNDKEDFVLSDSTKGVTPFRYYLQYVEKSTGKIEKYEDTDWGRSQAEAADSTSQQAAAKRLVARRAPLSTLTAEGWQATFLDLFGSQEVTAEMLEDYDILGLWDLYDQNAENNQYAVSAIYVPVPAGMELPYGAPLLVRAKHADAKPLVTEQRVREIDALLAEMAEQMSEEEEESVFDQLHYWCATFNGRYDIWQFVLPEKDSLLNEYGALAFAENGGDKFFNRVPASDNATMTPMSYCFTAYDARTFENLPLANDRIEIVVMDLPAEVLGIEDVRGKMDDVKGKRNAVYNLNGQKVGDSYRGIVIKNGRKIFNK